MGGVHYLWPRILFSREHRHAVFSLTLSPTHLKLLLLFRNVLLLFRSQFYFLAAEQLREWTTCSHTLILSDSKLPIVVAPLYPGLFYTTSGPIRLQTLLCSKSIGKFIQIRNSNFELRTSNRDCLFFEYQRRRPIPGYCYANNTGGN